jgi:GT2 family glycosyltransferase
MSIPSPSAENLSSPIETHLQSSSDQLNRMFSVFVSCHDATDEKVKLTITSLEAQSYRNFEVILLGSTADGSMKSKVLEARGCSSELQLVVADVLSASDKCRWHGEFAFVLKAGDSLRPYALERVNYHVRSRRSREPAGLVVFDHTLSDTGKPRFLPGWDPDLLEHVDYIQRACCISRELIDSLSADRPFFELHQFLLAARKHGQVLHVPEVLAEIDQGLPEVHPLVPSPGVVPAVSVIIPNRNGLALLPRCVDFLRRVTSPFELIIVDNASDDPAVWPLYDELKDEFDALIVPFNQSFNYARMINLGAAKAQHEFLLLLNNDVVVEDPNALLIALDFAARPEIGVVGSLLRYPDGAVQHAGMVLSRDANGGCDAEHVLRFSRHDEAGHIGALSAPRNWQCVTGAFQLVRKSVFTAAGGYDEVNLPVEHNDVDFCLRVRAMGLRVVCLPLAGIVHDESSTRSKIEISEARRLTREAHKVMEARWPAAFDHDPFRNPNLAKMRGQRSKFFSKLKSLKQRLATVWLGRFTYWRMGR